MSSAAQPTVAARPVRAHEIAAWAMFDFANSSYTTLIITVAFSVYFTSVLVPGGRGDFYWSIGIGISNLLTVALAPIVGAIGDASGRKKFLLALSAALCIAGTAGLYFADPGRVLLALVLFVVSNIAFSLGENLCASFLPELSTPKNVGRISGFGWGLGYFGGLGCLLVVGPWLTEGYNEANLPNLRIAWLLTAGFFLVSCLPTFLFLHERAPRGPFRGVGVYARDAFAHLRTTARSLRRLSVLARFLVVFFVFSCGLTAIIAFCGIFAVKTIGFTPGQLTKLFLALQIAAALGAVVFGYAQDRIGAKRTIQIVLVLWMAVCVAAGLCRTQELFWVVAMFAGLGIGSLQAAARAMVGLFSPRGKSGEMFAFWGLAGKSAYAVGPAVFGAVSATTGSQRLAIISCGVFFLLGLIGMFGVNEQKGREEALAWERADER